MNDKYISSNIQLDLLNHEDDPVELTKSQNEHFQIQNFDNDDKNEIMFKIEDPGLELDFFKVLFFSIIMGQPRLFINKLIEIDPE